MQQKLRMVKKNIVFFKNDFTEPVHSVEKYHSKSITKKANTNSKRIINSKVQLPLLHYHYSDRIYICHFKFWQNAYNILNWQCGL